MPGAETVRTVEARTRLARTEDPPRLSLAPAASQIDLTVEPKLLFLNGLRLLSLHST